MAAYTRKQYSGAARNTTTTTLLTNVGTTVDIAATTGWPSIAGIPFYVVINPSSIYEEKCLATISGSTLTLTRAQDDTTASEHPIGSVIYPVFTANDADEANELVSKLTTKGDLLVTDGSALHRLGVGANGFFLKANSSASVGLEWASIPTINSLDDVGDVTITDLEGGDILTYSNSASAWVNETVHFLTVSDTEPTDEVQEGDLWYNSSELELYTYYSGSWIQVTLTPEFPTVEELDNVYISTAGTGDVLAFDGLDWYNDTVSNLLGSHIIALSGDVSGSVLFDSSASVNISTTIQPNSVTLGTDTTGNYVNDLTAGTGVTITHTPSEGSSPTVAIGQAVGTSSSVQFAAVTAPLIGNSSTATTLENARTISLGGDVTGSVSFNGSSDISISATIQPNSVALGTDTTGNYMSGVSVGTALTVSHTPGEGSTATIGLDNAQLSNFLIDGVSGNSYGLIGTSAYLDAKNTNGYNKEIELDIVAVETKLTTDGYLKDSSTSSSVSFARLQTSGDVVVGGDLTVNGTTTTLNTETLLVEDNIVVLNSGITASPTLNSGIEVERGTSDNVSLRWNESTDSWELTEDGSTYKNIAVGQDVETSSSVTFSNVTADLVGDVTGNADTATALETARTIELSGDVSGSASFDGTANINLFTTVNTASVAIGELYGVNISSPEEFQTLGYNGTEWVNQYSSVVTYVRNAEATTLTTGTVVYLFGATGDHASVKRADNDSDATSSKTVGLVAKNILTAENGPIVTRGYVDGINLSVGYSAGDVLWLGEDGAFTKTKPTAPEHLVFIGVVVRATNNGIVYVATQNGYELDELHDVSISASVASGDFLKYNGSLWVNDPINLGTDTVGNYMLDVSAGTGISVSHAQGEGSTATISTTGVQTLGAKAGNYTLTAGDAAETIIIMDSSSANDLTVPSASAVTFGTGTSITVVQRGTGKTRILAGAGVTLLATPGVYLRARYSSCTLVKTENANEWFVIGDLAAS